MLVSISAIAASDADDTSLSSNNDNLTVQASIEQEVIDQTTDDTNAESSSESNQLLASSNDEDILGDSTWGQLSSKISSGSYVTLEDDYLNNNYGSSISIYRSNFVLDGQGHTINVSVKNLTDNFIFYWVF